MKMLSPKPGEFNRNVAQLSSDLQRNVAKLSSDLQQGQKDTAQGHTGLI